MVGIGSISKVRGVVSGVLRLKALAYSHPGHDLKSSSLPTELRSGRSRIMTGAKRETCIIAETLERAQLN